MKDDFRWSVEELLGKPPLDMILEGLGTLAAIHLEVRDPAGRSAGLGPSGTHEDDPILSPIQIDGREAGVVAGYPTEPGAANASMSVALAATLISQFLDANHAARDLAGEIHRRDRTLSLLERLGEGSTLPPEADAAEWFLDEALSLVQAPRGVLFRSEDSEISALAWRGPNERPRAEGLTRWILESGRPLELRSLGRFPRLTDKPTGEGCAYESFLTTPALGVPVGFGRKNLGVLWIYAGEDCAWKVRNTDLEILMSLAAQYGLILWARQAADVLQGNDSQLPRSTAETITPSAYSHPLPSEPELWVEGTAVQDFGWIPLRGGDPLFWVAFRTTDLDHPAASALVTRTAVQAAAERTTSPREALEMVEPILRRMEDTQEVPSHGLWLVQWNRDGQVQTAWRGGDRGPRIVTGTEDPASDPSGVSRSGHLTLVREAGTWMEGPADGCRLLFHDDKKVGA